MNFQEKRAVTFVLIVCMCILQSSGQCFAGAWTMPAGSLYERFAFNYYFADRQFDMDQDSSGFGHFRDANFSNYLEYGLTDRFTLINALYYKDIEKEDDSGESQSCGIGDIDLGVKAKVSEGSWGVVSTQALVKIPGDYGKNDKLPLGNGQYDLDVRVLYGRSLWPYLPGYCNFELAYRWRFEEPSDELRYLVEYGVDFTRELYGRIKLDGISSMDNGDQFSDSSGSGNPTATNTFDLGKLDLALGYKITSSWGLEICYTPEIYGNNTTAGSTWTLALTYRIK